jgi:hypothetical protein
MTGWGCRSKAFPCVAVQRCTTSPGQTQQAAGPIAELLLGVGEVPAISSQSSAERDRASAPGSAPHVSAQREAQLEPASCPRSPGLPPDQLGDTRQIKSPSSGRAHVSALHQEGARAASARRDPVDDRAVVTENHRPAAARRPIRSLAVERPVSRAMSTVRGRPTASACGSLCRARRPGACCQTFG